MLDIISTAVVKDGSKLYQHFKTIDYPVGRYFVIDNSCGKDESVTAALKKIQKQKSKYINEVVVFTTHQNTGYAGAVNLSVKQNTDCSYWIFTGYDWYVKKEELKKLADIISAHNNGMTLGTGNDEMCGIVLTPSLLNKVGLMDENFYPGYFEDNDYRYRQKLSNTHMFSFPLNNYHLTSSTLNSTPEFQQKNQFTFAKNLQYYMDKWGGFPGEERYERPFNEDVPIDYWQYNPKRTESLRWI